MTDISHIRVSDADRNGVVALLQEATVEGRLSLDELEERIGSALNAKFWPELEALVDDLPPVTVDAAQEDAGEPRGDEAPEGFTFDLAVRAGAIATLAFGALSIPVAFLSAAGTAVGLFAAMLGVLVVLAPADLARGYKYAVVGGVALGLLPLFFYVTLFLAFSA